MAVVARLIPADSVLARAIEAKRGAFNAAWEAARAASGASAEDEEDGLDADFLMRFGSAARAIFAAHEASVGADKAATALERWLFPLYRALLALATGGRLDAGHGDALASACASAPVLFAADPDGFALAVVRGYAGLRMRSNRGRETADRWAALIRRAAPACMNVSALRDAGCVAAWLAGLPEYRAEGVLLLAEPNVSACAALITENGGGGKHAAIEASRFAAGSAALARDPWLSFERAFGSRDGGALWFGSVGGHESVGGPFRGLPTVRAAEGRIVVTDTGRPEGDPGRERFLAACPEGLSLVPADADLAPFPDDGHGAKLLETAGAPIDGGGRVPASCRPIYGSKLVPSLETLAPFETATVGATLVLVSRSSYRVFAFGAEGRA